MPINQKCDFDGWATKNDIRCTDGRTIKDGAFSFQNGAKVPLVYQHNHENPEYVLGHCILEHRPGEGMYAYGYFNNNTFSQDVKELVMHGDLDSMSIWANELRQNGSDVLHGCIKEVSLVLAGANKGAKIQNTYIAHGDGSTSVDADEAIIKFGETIHIGDITHADDKTDDDTSKSKSDDDKSIEDILDSMNEKQRTVAMILIARASGENADFGGMSETDVKSTIESFSDTQKKVVLYLCQKASEEAKKSQDDDSVKHSDDLNTNNYEGDVNMATHNLFDQNQSNDDTLCHSEFITSMKNDGLFDKDAIRLGKIDSLKDFTLSHAAEYGIEDIEFLFPDARELNVPPEFIKRDDSWVDDFMSNSKHSPMSRVKTTFANITADEARAKGYVKGKQKVEEVITLLKRSVEPTTVYKLQKLDRDDILDITSFDVVVWLKMEMRLMLNEEIARAALVGDGRSPASDDHVDHTKIIPIWGHDELFTIPIVVHVNANDTDEAKADKIIKAVKKNFRHYRGSGSPTGYFSSEWTTNFTLIEDAQGRVKYDTTADAAKVMRLKKLVDCEIMENLTRTVTLEGGGSETRKLAGIIVNPIDYQFGADKGGAVSMFEDFDLRFNQKLMLMETRCSGMLTKPYSAFSVELVVDNG